MVDKEDLLYHEYISIIESFDPDEWKKEAYRLKSNFKFAERWVRENKDNSKKINRFIDLYLRCYNYFNPYQVRNIFLYCRPERIKEIVTYFHRRGLVIRYRDLVDDYVRLRQQEEEGKEGSNKGK